MTKQENWSKNIFIKMKNKIKIKSPCNKKCKVVDGECQSCRRTYEEIVSWKDLTTEQKLAVLQRLNDYKL
jgi:predicted Fe-S protein YdhL (DUF1289 family)